MKRLLIAALTCVSLTIGAQTTSQPTLAPLYYKCRVYFTDKQGSEYSLRHPERFLSERALQRRKRQGIKVDATDLPVSAVYLNQLRSMGLDVYLTSKWNNTAVVGTRDLLLMNDVAQLPFVAGIQIVAHYENMPKASGTNRKNRLNSVNNDYAGVSYREAYTQIDQLNGVALHGAGFCGQGMVIAIIDGGFYNADVIPGFAHTKILGTKDFVNPAADIFAESTHGMNVLSCIGANEPGYMIGTAPEASFWLLRSEDTYSEQVVEEDNWCAAVEFADSVGADVLNASLGYYDFDDDIDDLTYDQINGRTHINSRTASMIASKGMILCNSAGNEGGGRWGKIGTPADATDILAVGAIMPDRKIASFSSRGYSADGRVKPDVVAMGVLSAVYGANGQLSYSNGTSFSSPILTGMVACLWQALPHLNAYQIMDIIRRSGDRYDNPDETYGYGLPDFFKAYTMGLIMQ